MPRRTTPQSFSVQRLTRHNWWYEVRICIHGRTKT
jgi:hypothetical protein